MSRRSGNIADAAKPRLITSLAVALLVPFLARIPGALIFGPDWLPSYFPSILGVAFISAFNLIPGVALFLLAKAVHRSAIPHWGAVIGLTIGLGALHGSLDLASDSTAAIALVIFPIVAMVPMIAGWALGWAIYAVKHRS